MKKQHSDEQLEAFVWMLVNQAAADAALLNEIADSPATWWGVQRRINEQKPETLSAWPPVGKVLRWLMVGVPVTAAALLMLSFFVFRQAPNNGRDVVAGVSQTTAVEQKSPEAPRPSDESFSAITAPGDVSGPSV